MYRFPNSLGTWDVILARYHPNGTVDETFGVGGRVIADWGSSSDFVSDLAIQDDGKILAAGSGDALTPSQHNFVVITPMAVSTTVSV